MPELPEVETMRRGILSVCGAEVLRVFRFRSPRKPIAIVPGIPAIQRRLAGRTIRAVDRVGKRVVLVTDDEQRLVFEPRMTGLVLLEEPPTREHLRFGLQFRKAQGHIGELRFWDRRGLGLVSLYHVGEFHQRFDAQTIGPDALTVSVAQLRERFATSSSPLKVALLDQKKLAGVGNLYAAEILHRARIDPRLPCRRLTAEQWRRVHQEMRRVLRAAIRYEGSTLADGTYRNALNQSGAYQSHHLVYDRAGERCPTCRRGAIERIVQAQRATFFCPVCQRA